MTIKEGKAYTRDSVFRRCILEYGANRKLAYEVAMKKYKSDLKSILFAK